MIIPQVVGAIKIFSWKYVGMLAVPWTAPNLAFVKDQLGIATGVSCNLTITALSPYHHLAITVTLLALSRIYVPLQPCGR